MAQQLLNEYGPGLVSTFEVYFTDRAVRKHQGQPRGAFEGLRAMALVSARRDENNKTFFFLQNWCHEKQFVEVDLEYEPALLTKSNSYKSGERSRE